MAYGGILKQEVILIKKDEQRQIFRTQWFLWFTGVVEDRGDQELGRVRVRFLGHHTSNTTILRSSDRSWALNVAVDGR